MVWSQTDGSTHSVRVRLLDGVAKPVAPTRTVVSGWLALIDDPKLFKDGTDQMAAFAGIRSAAPSDPYVGPMVSARSPDGVHWTLEPGKLTNSTAAGNSQNIDAIDAGGVPFVAFSGFNPAVHLHRGFLTGAPTDTPDLLGASTCCNTYTSLARDGSNGRVWVAWHATGATAASDVGTRVQRIWPQPAGAALKAPGSTNAMGQSIVPGQPVALAARAGGGVWAAYLVGYPTSSRIRLWRVGTSTTLDFAAGGQASTVALTAGPSGRLWLSWVTLGDRVMRAVRTNPAVTRLGAVRTFPQPGGPTSQLRTTTLDGRLGPLDVVASAQVGTASLPKLYALHVLPAMRVHAQPGRLPDGKVHITVTDAGSPVRSATVRLLGKSARTDAHGRATMTVSKQVKDGSYPVVVTRSGYVKSTVRVRVT